MDTTPELTLHEELLLIALNDEKGANEVDWSLDSGLAAALLLELALAGRVEEDAGNVVPSSAVGEGRPRDPLAAEALEVLAAAPEAHDASHWVGKLPGRLKPLKNRVAAPLVERGILSEQRWRFLGVFPSTRFPTLDPAPERALRERLHEALTTETTPAPRTAVLVGLLAPLGLAKRVVDKPERKAAQRRADEIAEHGIVGPAVERSVAAVQAAVLAASIAALAGSAAASSAAVSAGS